LVAKSAKMLNNCIICKMIKMIIYIVFIFYTLGME
jgi:hypothetical protein